jgi:uncharacterized membrane protein YedE/YeeE
VSVRTDGTAFLAGALFSVGLTISGMTLPHKVVGFLDLTGDWDPSLAFVMAGALAVYGLAWRLLAPSRRTRMEATGRLPTYAGIDAKLLGGTAIFGVGWGLSGFCPGPAFTAAGAGGLGAITFVGAMLLGMGLHRWWAARGATRAVTADG